MWENLLILKVPVSSAHFLAHMFLLIVDTLSLKTRYTDLALGKKGLKVPSTALVDLVIALESNFQKQINPVVHSVGLGNKLLTSGMEVVSECRGSSV